MKELPGSAFVNHLHRHVALRDYLQVLDLFPWKFETSGCLSVIIQSEAKQEEPATVLAKR